jgi:hypothetical protein
LVLVNSLRGAILETFGAAGAVILLLALIGWNTATQAEPPLVLVNLEKDGSFTVYGKRHTDPREMKVLLENLERRVPTPRISLTVPGGSTAMAIQRAVKLLRDAGGPSSAC